MVYYSVSYPSILKYTLLFKVFPLQKSQKCFFKRYFLFLGNSPSSTPVSAKSPAGGDEDEADPPQLSVKREFSINTAKRSNTTDRDDINDDEEDSQQSNLLDCLVQAQNFALQQAAGNKNFENNINNFSPQQQHIMQGSQSVKYQMLPKVKIRFYLTLTRPFFPVTVSNL